MWPIGLSGVWSLALGIIGIDFRNRAQPAMRRFIGRRYKNSVSVKPFPVLGAVPASDLILRYNGEGTGQDKEILAIQ